MTEKTALPPEAMVEILTLSELPPLTSYAEQCAEALILAAHRCRNSDVWGGNRALVYWDVAFPDRVYAAAIQSSSLGEWWQRLDRSMSLTAPVPADREPIAVLLGSPEGKAALDVLAEQRMMMVLRVRVAVERSYERRGLTKDRTKPDPKPTKTAEPALFDEGDF